jgi:hypothetical protein
VYSKSSKTLSCFGHRDRSGADVLEQWMMAQLFNQRRELLGEA